MIPLQRIIQGWRRWFPLFVAGACTMVIVFGRDALFVVLPVMLVVAAAVFIHGD